MYKAFFDLQERPFELTTNPDFLYMSSRHQEALSNLQYGISERKGIIVLVGETGTGKTTLLRAALANIKNPNAKLVYVNNPLLSRAEFFDLLATGFELSAHAGASKSQFLLELNRTLAERQQAGLATALIIDEAQGLPHELMEEVRLLANMENSTTRLLPLVLAGQSELATRLNHVSLRQLKQRIGLRCSLRPFDLRETALYIDTRVRVAGGNAWTLFTAGAVQLIYQASRGLPRVISVLCDNALLGAFAIGRRPVDEDMVLQVCRDFDLQQPTSRSPGGPVHAPQPVTDTSDAEGRTLQPLSPSIDPFGTVSAPNWRSGTDPATEQSEAAMADGSVRPTTPASGGRARATIKARWKGWSATPAATSSCRSPGSPVGRR